MVRARSVGSLNSLQHMRGTRGSSALGRINSYLGGDARRRGRGMMALVCGGRTDGRAGGRGGGGALENYACDEGERAGAPAWTRRNTKHTLGLKIIGRPRPFRRRQMYRGEEDPVGRRRRLPVAKRHTLRRVDRCIRPNRRSRNERRGGTTGGR